MKLRNIFLVLLLFAVVGLASANTYPTLTGYVNDFAGLLTPSEEAMLAGQIGTIERNTTVQIAIVTVQSTNGEDTILYGAHTGTQNGVGQKATDNGIVIVYSVADGGGIATGRGIESTITDYVASNIGRGAHPYFESGQYYAGFAYIVNGIDEHIEMGLAPKAPPVDVSVLLIGAVIALMLFAIMAWFISRSVDSTPSYSHHDYTRDATYAATMGSIHVDRHHHHDDDDDSGNSGFSWGGGGGDSGGFGGFGGGGFGGGGGHF